MCINPGLTDKTSKQQQLVVHFYTQHTQHNPSVTNTIFICAVMFSSTSSKSGWHTYIIRLTQTHWCSGAEGHKEKQKNRNTHTFSKTLQQIATVLILIPLPLIGNLPFHLSVSVLTTRLRLSLSPWASSQQASELQVTSWQTLTDRCADCWCCHIWQSGLRLPNKWGTFYPLFLSSLMYFMVLSTGYLAAIV